LPENNVNLKATDKTHEKKISEEKAQSKSADASIPQAGNLDVKIDLEEIFPKIGNLFDACVVEPSSDSSVMVAFDINALLLPYKFSKDDLSAINEVFRTLAEENRLFVPARCVREFINLRDRKLAELVKALNDKKSKLIAADDKL
jgi:hypothetical protein